MILFLDPKNKSVEPILVRLHQHVQAKIDERSTTNNKVETMANLGRYFDDIPRNYRVP